MTNVPEMKPSKQFDMTSAMFLPEIVNCSAFGEAVLEKSIFLFLLRIIIETLTN